MGYAWIASKSSIATLNSSKSSPVTNSIPVCAWLGRSKADKTPCPWPMSVIGLKIGLKMLIVKMDRLTSIINWHQCWGKHHVCMAMWKNHNKVTIGEAALIIHPEVTGRKKTQQVLRCSCNNRWGYLTNMMEEVDKYWHALGQTSSFTTVVLFTKTLI